MIQLFENKIAELTAKGFGITIAAAGKLVLECDELIIVAGIIGIYFMIFGDKKRGTRLTSLSLLVYFLAEVMSKC
ncbi:hypothetical protein OD350_28900 (plasmid) [Clostridium beijerinckii]|uniref:hypothetical protein n=1 Tax=Clostridium beijerinckii TaxID=1520 RepID=UPI0022273DB0|nr:hypothetical protein [Clostridium beijerinckii]UYZ39094.1 hypothetical protein OD350_28900 [Clostridium beijerinckii]